MIHTLTSQSLHPVVLSICRAIRDASGRALLVGGGVRDRLMGHASKDYDLEVYYLQPDVLRSLIERFGAVNTVGESFTVYKLRVEDEAGPFEIDVSLPRRESKVARGHRGFAVTGDPFMSFEEAARRRDFTINAIMYDSLAEELIDPHGGVKDIENRILRAIDARTFVEDSLRVLRAMQFTARFECEIEPKTKDLCRSIDLSDLPKERVWGEFEKLFLLACRPSLGLQAALELLIVDKRLPDLKPMVDCPQDPAWHPEGWSLTELPLQAGLARPAETIRVDRASTRLREFIASATATSTMIPTLASTPGAQPTMDEPVDSFSTTDATRTDSLSPSPPFSPTILTKPERLVWLFGTTALNAGEVVRIVFKVPLRRMKAVVLTAVDDFEVVRQIVHPVAIYVMNMLPSFQGTTELQFHNDAVDRGGPVASGPRGVHIPRVVVDARTAAVDGNVLFDFDLAVVGNRDLHIADLSTKHRLFQVERGDVWVHTLMAVDNAVELTEGLPKEKKLTVILAVLLHDIAKPQTTIFERGHIRSPEHEEKGREPSQRVLDALNVYSINGYDVRGQVVELVANHLKPSHFYKDRDRVTDGAFRRLARKCDLELLYLVSKADALARGPASESVSQEWFIERARALAVEHAPPKPILMGRHLIQLGVEPGPRMGEILQAVYELQLDGKVTSLEEALEAARKVEKAI